MVAIYPPVNYEKRVMYKWIIYPQWVEVDGSNSSKISIQYLDINDEIYPVDRSDMVGATSL